MCNIFHNKDRVSIVSGERALKTRSVLTPTQQMKKYTFGLLATKTMLKPSDYLKTNQSLQR